MYKFCLSQHVVDNSYLVSVLFREAFSHPYISYFHLLVNAFSVIIIRVVEERICRITDRILRSVERLMVEIPRTTDIIIRVVEGSLLKKLFNLGVWIMRGLHYVHSKTKRTLNTTQNH